MADQAQAARTHTTKTGKKRKGPDEWRVKVDQAAKNGDVEAGIAAFAAAREAGAQLTQYTYNVLLHLCAGGDDWETKLARDRHGDFSAGEEVVAHMVEHSIQPSEATFTARARLAALQGDPARALTIVKEAAEVGGACTPRLRTYAASLVGHCVLGSARAALDVRSAILTANLELTEAEYTHLIKACTTDGLGDEVWTLLECIATELVGLKEPLREAIRAWAESGDGQSVLSRRLGGDATTDRPWTCRRVTVNGKGDVEGSGCQLRKIDLKTEEFDKFADGVAAIARGRETSRATFSDFEAWLARHGPYDVIVDGANVALYGQNHVGGGFSFPQLRSVVEHFAPTRKVLVVLHVRRTRSPEAQQPMWRAFLDTLKQRHQLFICPGGSNDDWYWMYAAVKAGVHGVVVSNDEMRDHIFSLLAPRYFKRWKQHHQTKVSFTPQGKLGTKPPAAYTVCLQMHPGYLMVPSEEEQDGWLCISNAQ